MLSNLGAAHREARRGLWIRGLDAAVTDVFRQVSIFRFENAVHLHVEAHGSLPVEAANDLWMTSQKELHGDAVEAGEGYEAWWSFVPQIIRNPGRSATYALGQLITLALARERALDASSFGRRFVELLACGGSRPTALALEDFGVDASSHEAWRRALAHLDSRIACVERAFAGCP